MKYLINLFLSPITGISSYCQLWRSGPNYLRSRSPSKSTPVKTYEQKKEQMTIEDEYAEAMLKK